MASSSDVYRCPKCGHNMYAASQRRAAISGGKAVVGAMFLGPIGLAAGLLGKKKVTFQCEKCGYIAEI